jgi:hypothetical protein
MVDAIFVMHELILAFTLIFITWLWLQPAENFKCQVRLNAIVDRYNWLHSTGVFLNQYFHR